MPRRKVSRRNLLQSCATPGPDDGLDPRYDRSESSDKVTNRKAIQLCGQVADTLALVLAGDSGDERLREVVIVSVVPAPNTSRLLVTVSPSVTVESADLDAIQRQFARARTRLRSEIASAIHRRRVPDLTFRVVKGR